MAWVTFLSDYGLEDAYVGVCKGVLARTAPDVRVIDVCHQVEPQDVEQGAATLLEAIPYLPSPAVHLALVDPFRATPARGVVVVTGDGSAFVTPDNGLTAPSWEPAGGVVRAYAIENAALWPREPSRTFRGRDVFAPVAGHLAAGTDPADVGPEIDPGTLVVLTPREAYPHDDHVHGEVKGVDHFGNLALTIRRSHLEAVGVTLGDRVEVTCGGKTRDVPFVLRYGEVPPGHLALCEDSVRAITLAVNQGDAAKALRAGRGDPLVVGRVHVPVESPDQTTIYPEPPSLVTP